LLSKKTTKEEGLKESSVSSGKWSERRGDKVGHRMQIRREGNTTASEKGRDAALREKRGGEGGGPVFVFKLRGGGLKTKLG